MDEQELEKIEEYIVWNLSFGITIEESLKYIHKSHLLEEFLYLKEID
jgi:hypothetical protein